MKQSQEINQLKHENALLKKQLDRLYCERGKHSLIADLQESLILKLQGEIESLRATLPNSLYAVRSTLN